MKFPEITEKIIVAALEVHSGIGPGVLESVYKTCLAHELKQAEGIKRIVTSSTKFAATMGAQRDSLVLRCLRSSVFHAFRFEQKQNGPFRTAPLVAVFHQNRSVDRNSLELGAAFFVLKGADVARDQVAVVAVQGKIGAGGCNGIRGDKVERRQRVHNKGVAGIVGNRVAAVAGEC